jgi:hypothetical protein
VFGRLDHVQLRPTSKVTNDEIGMSLSFSVEGNGAAKPGRIHGTESVVLGVTRKLNEEDTYRRS